METKIGSLKKNIANSFTRIGHYLTFTNSLGYTDFNSDAERFFIEILNTTYGYALRELNAERPNFPAIDLADNRRKVCIQVTTTGDNTKFKETLSVYKRNGFDKTYNELVFLILAPDHKITAIDKEVYTTIISLTDLLKSIASLNDSDIQYIDSYISEYLQERKSGFDSSPQHGIHYKLGRATRFIKWCDVDDEDVLENDLKRFTQTLSELTNDQRSYLHFLVIKGHFPTSGRRSDRERIVIPTALERAHYGERGYDLFNSVKALDLVKLDDEYDQNGDERLVVAIVPIFRGEYEEINLFAKIRKFVNGDATKLRKIFLLCDFSCLD